MGNASMLKWFAGVRHPWGSCQQSQETGGKIWHRMGTTNCYPKGTQLSVFVYSEFFRSKD